MAKLTLSVDDRVVSGAKEYAKRQGLSVSHIVETYLAALGQPGLPGTALPGSPDTPVLRSVRGILRGSDAGACKTHLATKYRA